MLKRLKRMLLVALCCVSCAPIPATKPTAEREPRNDGRERWVAYYSNTLPAEDFLDYDLVLFDRLHHPPIAPLLQDPNRVVLAYVSVGEAHGYRREELAALEREGAVLKPNPDWDSHVVDLTSPTWRAIVMAEVQDAIERGFHGVMLDTIDSPLVAAAERSATFGADNRAAAIALIAQIRKTHPDIKLMMNRGFEILPEVSGQLDFVLAESILAETNVSTRHSYLFSPMSYRQMTKLLEDVRRTSPRLKIYALDYWNSDDVDGIRQLYAIQRSHGYVPYVTTPDLKTHTPEPHSTQTHTGKPNGTPVKPVREDIDA
jgi:uncharacterized protein (TIGR01370 family)